MQQGRALHCRAIALWLPCSLLQVRREAVRCLGLYCLLDHIPSNLGGHLKVLRAQLLGWSPSGGGVPAEVAMAAAQVGRCAGQ